MNTNYNQTNTNPNQTNTTSTSESSISSPTSFARKKIQQIIESNLYRTLHYGYTKQQYIFINGHKMINLCSNDYLAMSTCDTNNMKNNDVYNHPDNHIYKNIENKSSDRSIVDEYMQIPASSRLLSGSTPAHSMLENALSESKSYESTLVYPTGYMANIGVIPVLADAYDNNQKSVIFSDALNHVSIIDACRLARKTTITYTHNDISDLETKISQYDNQWRKIIVTEGVFSMDGDLANLNEISKIAQKYNAILVVDDAHGDFVLGSNGRGTPSHLNITHPSHMIHVYISSLSKALGSFGGYVAADKNIIDLCINQSRSFIYTSALPPHIAKHAYLRVTNKQMQHQRKNQLEQNVRLVSQAIKNAGYETYSKTHIMPIIIHNEDKALQLSKHLFANGVYAPAIRYPTVPRGQARLRISVTAWLDDGNITALQRALESAT